MKSIRLIPVVIFAALALLVFKGVGLVTNGGYVLTGPAVALAADEHAADGEGGMPSDAVIADTSPTLDDGAPTLVTKPEMAEPSSSEESQASSSESQESSQESSAEADSACANDPSASAPAETAHGGDLTDRIGNALASSCPSVAIPVNEHGDALPMIKDGAGKIVPLEVAEGDNSEAALTARLNERREQLDSREAEIAMRSSLLEAAEKRLDERTKALAALEAQVAALVDEKQAAEDAGFKAVVSMYETMKPKEAAKIFDTLSLPVLLKVARAMNPRKMSPILAAMSPKPAEALTTAFASTESTDIVPASGENLAALPQIVGQ